MTHNVMRHTPKRYPPHRKNLYNSLGSNGSSSGGKGTFSRGGRRVPAKGAAHLSLQFEHQTTHY